MAKRTGTHFSVRHGVYYYQRRVPKAVMDRPAAFQLFFSGRQAFRKSLGTKVYAEALAKAAIVEVEFDSLVSAAIGGKSVMSFPIVRRIFDAAALGEIARMTRDRISTDWRQEIVQAEVTVGAAESLERRIERGAEIRSNSHDVSSALGASSIHDQAVDINQRYNYNFSENSNEFAELKRAIIDGVTQAYSDINQMLNGKSLPDQPSSTLISQFSKPNKSLANRKKFSEVADEQFNIGKLSPKTVQKYKRAQREFISIVGDKFVDEINRNDVRSFLDFIASRKIGRDILTSRSISRTTLQSYLIAVSSTLATAIGRGWCEGPNPASGIKLEHWLGQPDPRVTPPKRRFQITELNLLFSHPWFSGCSSSSACYAPGSTELTDMRYWAAVVALYTGARASELGGLKVSDVSFKDHPYILIQPNQYRTTKSRHSREVPILDGLIRIGFKDYYDRIVKLGSDRIFPDWECPKSYGVDEEDQLKRWASSKWIRAFNRTVIHSVFPLIAPATRSPITFHSLRGSFKKMLLDHGNDKMANAIIGHSQDELDRAYIGKFDVNELWREFHKAEFENLVIPSRASAVTEKSIN